MSGISILRSFPRYEEHKRFLSLLKSKSPVVRTAFDLTPSPIAIWSSDHSFCVVNRAATRLIGFTERSFRQDPSLWMKRVRAEDRQILSSVWTKLHAGEELVTSDYRFAPKGTTDEIWLRDMSIAYHNSRGEIEAIASSYTNVSDLKTEPVRNSHDDKIGSDSVIIDGMVHEIQNNLQVMAMGLDLLTLDRPEYLECQPIFNCIERTKNFIDELREYFLPPGTEFAPGNPAAILGELVRDSESDYRRQRIRVRMGRANGVPLLPIDSAQLRAALSRVLRLSHALLPQGGKIEADARPREIGTQRYAELSIIVTSTTSLALEEKDVFQPFLRINNYDVGLSIALSREILRRHDGDLYFSKVDDRSGKFTILLNVR